MRETDEQVAEQANSSLKNTFISPLSVTQMQALSETFNKGTEKTEYEEEFLELEKVN